MCGSHMQGFELHLGVCSLSMCVARDMGLRPFVRSYVYAYLHS